MGFYNSSDTSEDVKNPELESNVEPISFDDVVGKNTKYLIMMKYMKN